MIRNLLSVGGFTLLSRITGFLRDVMLSGILGAGLAADAFFIAFRLPNHFRAIFGEGAFNAAYVPCYSKALEQQGKDSAKEFSSEVFTLLLASQIVLLLLAYAFMPQFVALLAPGLDDRPEKFALAVSLTRITFPYLLCMTLVTLHQGTLNANGRFAAPAFAPNLLNLTMIAALAVAFLFPSAAYAAAWGVTISGVLQLALLMANARMIGVMEGLARPHWKRVREFFLMLGPAVIGSASGQIAIFADTIIASMLPDGGVSSINYADRIYQLPNGVIGLAAGTVLLPEMSRRIAAGDEDGAHAAQNRVMALTVALAAPFFIAFVTIPELIMSGVFLRGAFTHADAVAAADVLAAYGGGLMALVLIASARASFQAHGDTKTPMYVALGAVVVNVGLKIALYEPMGAPGLATATSVGLWINLAALIGLALHRGAMRFDETFLRVSIASLCASAPLLATAFYGYGPAMALAGRLGPMRDIAALLLLGAAGALVYAGVLAVCLRAFGLRLSQLRRAKR
ncbi:murein biosynthesis integral membrane protein MurJ [Methylosinus sp. LW4]|uniref:murein biosynthesis integral membrane protein MurJ n=1 Tax=Methylosinus sp. LW4 TaxID=136993 RepID=UPI00036F462B|nr:murein biosynthesis integral membrane protein MurJ [Methylosinus sp. LW4]